ncbi:MAG: serine protease [Bacteroides sp. SM23_62_1]|nr:MAG: serine protease [Bacteroides sp. SM23_62_1]
MKRFLKLIAASIIGSTLTIAVFMLTGIDKNDMNIITGQSNLPVHRTVYTVNESGEVVPLDFTGVSKEVMNSVVHIKSTRKIEGDDQAYFYNPFGDMWGDDLFKFFFGEPPQQRQERIRPEPFIQQGTGSGVIISSNGYIVTNNHVVEDADDIEVTLYDNEVYKAKIVGTDPSTDIALIQIKNDGLHPLTLGNSDNVEIGEWVLAIGNPFNLNSTVTAGIISAKGRNINIINDKTAIEAFIQTDAAINPGNSGGALVNLNGELIGINTAIASQTGAYMGYGFAIPANIVSKVVEDIMRYGMVQRAFLGVMIHDINGDLVKQQNLKVTEGAYVDSLTENGAALEAGIKRGDVIVKVDEKTIVKSADLLEQIGRHRPGDEVLVTVNRAGREFSYKVVLANQKGVKKIIAKDKQDILDILGASFETLDEARAKDLGIDGGVVVKDLQSGVLSSQTDMRQGFIITGVNKVKINSVDDLRKELKDAKGGVLLEGFYENYPGQVFYAFGIE